MEQTITNEIKKFVVQAIRGVLINNFRYGGDVDCTVGLYAFYLNSCWHNYGKKDDPYVIDVVDRILNYNHIKGTVCLFHWFLNIGVTILKQIDMNSISHIIEGGINDNKRNILGVIIGNYFDIIIKNIGFDKLKCTGNDCDNKYDGTDLFTTS